MNLVMMVMSLILISPAPAAITALKMKPGKWKIDSTVATDGKAAVNPMTQIQEAMKKMTPEQKKQMEAMMAKMGNDLGQTKASKDKSMPKVGFDQDGMTICYTKEMLETGLDVKKKQEEHKCKVSDHIQTDKKISMKFKCDDGSSGYTEWKVADETHMSGFTKTVSSKGKKGEINFKAQYLTSKCD